VVSLLTGTVIFINSLTAGYTMLLLAFVSSFVCVLQQEQKRQEVYEEFLKEKLMIDEIVRKIYEEDQR